MTADASEVGDTAELWYEWTDAATWRPGDDEPEEDR